MLILAPLVNENLGKAYRVRIIELVGNLFITYLVREGCYFTESLRAQDFNVTMKLTVGSFVLAAAGFATAHCKFSICGKYGQSHK